MVSNCFEGVTSISCEGLRRIFIVKKQKYQEKDLNRILIVKKQKSDLNREETKISIVLKENINCFEGATSIRFK